MTEDIRICKVTFVGNKNTNKHSNNVRLVLTGMFDDTDELTIIDLFERRKTSGIKVRKLRNGSTNSFTYNINSKLFQQHKGKYAILEPITKLKAQDIKMNLKALEGCKIPKYLVTSNNEDKDPLLIYILNTKMLELGLWEHEET